MYSSTLGVDGDSALVVSTALNPFALSLGESSCKRVTMATQDFASSVALFSDKPHDNCVEAPVVVLPPADSRQPQSKITFGSEQLEPPQVNPTRTGNSASSFNSDTAYINPRFRPSSEVVTGGLNELGFKRLRPRGTRGKGDRRNARMRLERLRAQMVGVDNILHNSKKDTSQPTVTLRGRGLSTFGELNNPDSIPSDFPHLPHHSNEYGDSVIAPRVPATMRRTPQQRNSVSIHGPPSSNGRRNNTFRRPPPQAFGRQLQNSRGPEHRRPGDDWSEWIELGIKLAGLPRYVTTLDLWRAFSKEGSVATIEIFEDSKGERDGKGRIRFSPPPAKPFWQAMRYRLEIKGSNPVTINLELDVKRRLFLAPSPVNQNVKYPESTVGFS